MFHRFQRYAIQRCHRYAPEAVQAREMRHGMEWNAVLLDPDRNQKYRQRFGRGVQLRASPENYDDRVFTARVLRAEANRDFYRQNFGSNLLEIGLVVPKTRPWFFGCVDAVVPLSRSLAVCTGNMPIHRLVELHSPTHMPVAMQDQATAELAKANPEYHRHIPAAIYHKMQGNMWLLDVPLCHLVLRADDRVFEQLVPFDSGYFYRTMLPILDNFAADVVCPRRISAGIED